jgi:polygalacturonase
MRLNRRQLLVTAGAAVLPSAFLTGCGSTYADKIQRAEASDAWLKLPEIIAQIKPPVFAKRIFPLRDFGLAANLSESPDSTPEQLPDILPALRAAIAACHAAGGGRVEVPSGRWFVAGPIHLQSRVDLHLSAGAHLIFSGNAEHYLPAVRTRWEGVECFSYSPMVYAAQCQDVAITGTGTLDGQGAKNWLPWRALQKPDQNRMRQMGKDGVAMLKRQFGAGTFIRPHFVQFYQCQNVLVENITLRDSPFWVMHPVYCENVTVRGIQVVSHHVNSDGVDPDSSRYVLIENCRFEVGDDGVAIKAGRDQDGWRVGRPSQFIVVRNCQYIGDTGGGVAIGSEMSGGVSDVYIEGFSIPEANHALYFKSNLDRGGQIERIYIRDIEVGKTDSLLIFTNSYHGYRGGNAPTRFQYIALSNIRCGKANVGISIEGNASAPIQNIRLCDIRIDQATTAFAAQHARNLSFENVLVNNIAIEDIGQAVLPVALRKF